MIEKEIVYSNPVRIDDDTIQLDKSSKVVVSVASLLVNKESHGLELAKIDMVLEVLKGL